MESPRQGYNCYTGYLDAWIAHAKLPWPTQQTVAWPHPPTDLIAQLFSPNFEPVEVERLVTITFVRLLETRLALRAYDLDHGRYPGTIQELSPKYLPSTPMDPFANNQPLGYNSTGVRYVLYSVGPDAVDDGGNPIDKPAATHRRYDVLRDCYSGAQKQGCRGDIVAGVSS